MREIVVGTRDSQLALWQANWVVDRLRERNPGYSFRIQGIKTHGDNILDVALAKIGDKGLFTKELEVALLSDEIDLAVHSMKDLPTDLPGGLAVGAVCEREYPGDVLVSSQGYVLDKLPEGAVIGTSSLRRTAQLLHYRQDLRIVNIRGNLNTRLRKMDEEKLDGVVLAYAGIQRLGLKDRITERIPMEICLPAVGQGSIGIEIRHLDEEIMDIVETIEHRPSRIAVSAERNFLKRLEGGCQVPIGAYGLVIGNEIKFEGLIASLDGKHLVRDVIAGPVNEAAKIGVKLAESLLKKGGREILRAVRQENC
ncbi:porphobilinogen deaminase [Desulfofarcimen acetoxidans DSM 771]|jgi:hydroxymethylbilane synthase|uniref:Porphobilinogen deaminase n=2 Tax=Desulfofarcimen acetoxidans TaxID=58138 RepID=C8W5F1_DESAS|nr:porphobilinogen deaminase [Desulfofarcimen acetoxidans DSM 771]